MKPGSLLGLFFACAIADVATAQIVVRTKTADLQITDRSQRTASGWEVPSLPTGGRLESERPLSHAMKTPRFKAISRQGEAMPAGETGTLADMFTSATLDASGRGAFVAQVDGSVRNQGIFFADAEGIKIIVMGCGAGGGSGSTDDCGDPTPIGGTFSGMFQGTTPAPAANDSGDVLFLADIAGAPAPRGLFLYRAIDETIIKIAAVGDPSPRGGFLTAVGPGAINNPGTVVFPASTVGDGSQGADILMWRNGVLTTYVAAGDPAPDGESFTLVGGEAFGFQDGTWIPTSVPAINDSNQIAFSGNTPTGRGLFLSSNGAHERLVRWDDPAPGGEVFFDFRGDAVLNERGEIAFMAYTAEKPAAPPTGGGWFVGRMGSFRSALKFYDPLQSGRVYGLAFSRNPFRPLDDAGNLALWARYQLADESEFETMLVVSSNGAITTLAAQGQPSPLGGWWGGLWAWPTSNNTQVQFAAGTPGLPGSTHGQFVATHHLDVVFRNSFEASEQKS